ncbi:hypothetical protein SH601_09170 [Gracilibacillus sp. S3-1-1]|uniref:Uncharacterized protein n=1 Tax=Gracilibacillus pellucidus TaxID=3095368 RepID=A0ACC6M5G8_9BACI|nr:hypothetical protein [Gracilibacillus sp. S3-1-1]MDX8046160.1 hypothetical protein [Gracilibacillus sp. S3-1-1]
MKLYLLSFWSIIDPIYYVFTRLTYLDNGKETEKNIFRVRLTRYKGRDYVLSDGTVVHKNDLFIKIHLHNAQLISHVKNIDSEIRRALIIHQMVEKSLPKLAEYLHDHAEFNEIKGIIGITMLNRGTRRLGFDTMEIENRYYKGFKSMALFPIYWLSVSSITVNSLKKHDPCYLFMSKEKLLDKYYCYSS